MSCCNKVKITPSASCDCNSSSFKDALKDLDCNITISYGDCVTAAERVANDIALAQLLRAVCALKGLKLHKETTYKELNIEKHDTTNPIGKPSTPEDGDIYVLKYTNGFGIYSYSLVDNIWIDISGANVCLDSVVKIQAEDQNYFEDDLVGVSFISTGLDFTGLLPKDISVFQNGKKIYCKDVTTNGDVIWGYDPTLDTILFYHGAQGSGTVGDSTTIGTVDVPCYVEVIAANYQTTNDLLSC